MQFFFHRICPPLLLILVIIIISSKESIAQNGIVVINEFNPEKGCSPYIELKNLGPGRQDIGCYKLVNEKYAITIPPNTVLDPGQIYMIGGTNTIDNCGSIPSVPVDLNWTSCSNCTSVPLTTDAFFAGWENSKSYPLLLYSASNTILDAMRSTANNLATITAPTTNTATSSGAGCSTSTINIPTDISSPSTVYESIGQNLGANATFSRSGDGSCTWYKATSDKRTPGRNNQTESGTATVGATSSYNLTCTTSGYSSTLTITVTSTPYWYQFVFFPNSDPLNGSVPVSQSDNTNQNIVRNNPAPGIYSYVFAPTADASCGQIPFSIEVIDPIMTVSPTYSVDCYGGIAELKITNPGASNTVAPYYFPISYSVTSSTSTFTASGTDPDPDVVRISQIPQGTYTATITPASEYACPNVIPFSITTPPLTVLSATISPTAACSGGTADGFADLALNNNNPELYYPINFTLNRIEGAVSSLVYSGTFSEPTKKFTGLTSGQYEILLDPQADGCLTGSTFTIDVSETDCSLRDILKNFSVRTSGIFLEFSCKLDAAGILREFFLESSMDGKNFTKVTNVFFENKTGFQDIQFSVPAGQETFFRLQLIDIHNKKFLSPILRIGTESLIRGMKVYPNPFRDQLGISINTSMDDLLLICVMNTEGVSVKEEQCTVKKGLNSFSLNTTLLTAGSYYLCTQMVKSGEKQVTRVIKQ